MNGSSNQKCPYFKFICSGRVKLVVRESPSAGIVHNGGKLVNQVSLLILLMQPLNLIILIIKLIGCFVNK